jgi:Sigma-70 region 2
MESGSQPGEAGVFHVIDGDRPLDWEGVYRDHVTSIYRLLYYKVGNQHDAEDLTAQVFLEALPRLRASASGGEIHMYLRADDAGRSLAPPPRHPGHNHR